MSAPIAWITGSAGGIGSAVCVRLRRDGWTILGFDRVNSAEADVSLVCDLGDAAELTATAERALLTGPPSAVVHLAADQPLKGAGELGPAGWARTLQVNLISLDMLTGSARAGLKENRGSIVAVTSVHARATTKGIAPYAASKAALEGWVRAAALDLGPEICVNALATGAVNTPKLTEGFARWGDAAGERRQLLEQRTPVGRIADAPEIAGLVAFLLGADSRFVSGSVLTADGGALARLGTE